MPFREKSNAIPWVYLFQKWKKHASARIRRPNHANIKLTTLDATPMTLDSRLQWENQFILSGRSAAW
jgi:hypothetical protein